MMHKNTAKGAASLYLSNLIALFVITGHFVVLTNTLSITNIGVIFGFQILKNSKLILEFSRSQNPNLQSAKLILEFPQLEISASHKIPSSS